MRGFRRALSALFVLGACVVVMQACGGADVETRPVGAGCVLPSDCTDPLVCVFQRCHQQCLADRDCPPNTFCSGAQAPKKGVCLLPDEIACERSSDCHAGLVCGRRKRCETPCKDDGGCLASQTCDRGSCVDKEHVLDGGVLGGKVGETCVRNSDCDATLVCFAGKCDIECRRENDGTTRDCRDGEVCIDSVCRRAGAISTDAGVVDAPANYGKPCVYSSECGFPLVCRSSAVCGWECNADYDCKSDSHCKDRVCVFGKPSVTDAGTIDAAIDGGPGSGKPCTAAGDCPPTKFCDGAERCIAGACRAAIEGPCVSHTACTIDSCDESTKTCKHTPTSSLDADGDGHFAVGCGGDDCDDKDPTVYHGALELCDGKDNDCNGKIDDFAVAPRTKETIFDLSTTDRDNMVVLSVGGKWMVLTGSSTAPNKLTAMTIDTTGKASADTAVALSGLAAGALRPKAATLTPAGLIGLVYGESNSTGLTEARRVAVLKSDLSLVFDIRLTDFDSTPGDVASIAWNGTAFLVGYTKASVPWLTLVKPDGMLVTSRELAGAVGNSIKVAARGTNQAVAYVSGGVQLITLDASLGKLVGPVTIPGASAVIDLVVTGEGFGVLTDSGSSFEALVLTTVSLAGVLGSSVIIGNNPFNASITTDGVQVAICSRTTPTDLRLHWSTKGLAGPFEVTLPWPTGPDSPDLCGVSILAGPQVGLFNLHRSGDKKLHFARIGCAP